MILYLLAMTAEFVCAFGNLLNNKYINEFELIIKNISLKYIVKLK